MVLRQHQLHSEGNKRSYVTATLGRGGQETNMEEQVDVKPWASKF